MLISCIKLDHALYSINYGRWNTAIWATVDQAKCEKYIGHLQKVIPKMIELEGSATLVIIMTICMT